MLSENVTVGNPCVYPSQCRGTKFASACNHYGQCECQAGYILNGNSCFQGKFVQFLNYSNKNNNHGNILVTAYTYQKPYFQER